MASACVFYGFVQPNKDDIYWKRAVERFCAQLEDPAVYDGPVYLNTVGRDNTTNCILVVDSLQTTDCHQELQDMSANSYNVSWDALLVDFCSQWGIQIYDQIPCWHIALR